MGQEKPKPEEAPVKEPLPNSWIVILAGLAVCVAAAGLLGLVVNQHLKTRPVNLRYQTLCMAVAMEDLFRSALIAPEHIRTSARQLRETDSASWFLTSFDVETEGVAPEGLVAILDREMVQNGASVTAGKISNGILNLEVFLGGLKFAEVRLHVPPPAPAPPQRPIKDDDPGLVSLMRMAGLGDDGEESAWPALRQARVAIILDDGGYGGPVTEAVLKLDPRLTLSILPGAPDAVETARKTGEAGFELLLHLPMESPEDPGWISVSTPADEMARLLTDALERVPGAVGINNHMGSTFCTNEQALARFFDVMKARMNGDKPLFFVDSRTTHETKIPDAARKAGVRVAERKVFLDNDSGDGEIQAEFDRLVQCAMENGTAIGIGHFRQATADALKKLLPELEKHGISLVHVSQVVQ